MSEWTWAGKLLEGFGVLGLMAFGMVIFYRLTDKWAARFLEAQVGQTRAMTEQAAAVTGLATAVREGQSDQREILIAVRVLASRIEEHRGYLVAIEKNCRERGGGCAA